MENGRRTSLSREHWRELIWPRNKEETDRKAYDPRFISLFGSSAGLLLSQLVFWSEKGHDPNDWVYKTKKEIQREIGLTPRQTDYARKKLEEQGILRADKRPRRDRSGRVVFPSPVYHYLVNLEALAGRLGIEASTASGKAEPNRMSRSNPPERRTRSRQSAGSVSHNMGSSYTESTSRDNPIENVSENRPLQGGAAGFSSRLAHHEQGITTTAGFEGVSPLDNDMKEYIDAPRRRTAKKGKADAPPPSNDAPSKKPPQLSPQMRNRVWWLLCNFEDENDVTRLADKYLRSPEKAEGQVLGNGEPPGLLHVAEKTREYLGSEEPLPAFVPWVESCLEERRQEAESAAV